MKKLFWLLAAPVLLVSSCKKDSDNTPTPNPGSSACILTEERDSVGNKLSSSYEYDANRRITKQFYYSNGVKSGYSTFTFSGNTLSLQDYRMDNSADGSPAIATLNSSGNITSLISTSPDTVDGTPGISKDTTSLTYNSTGQLSGYTSRSWTRDGSNNVLSRNTMTFTFEYTAGRVSKQTNNFSSTRGTSTENSLSVETFTYDNASPVVTSNPAVSFFSLPGSDLFGKIQSDRIPVKSETTYTDESGSSTGSKTFSAIVDSKGNPTKIRIYQDIGGGWSSSYTTLYSYNCP